MREKTGDKIFTIFNALLMVFVCLIMIYPIVFVVGRSLMTDAERALNPLALFPANVDFTAYKFIFMRGSYMINAYAVTIARTIFGTFMNMVFSCLFAYVLSKKDYPLRIPLTFLVIFTMWFKGGLIPDYLLMRSLNITNTFFAYIFPGLISAWNMLILRNFFMSIPDSIEESAKIDGANEIGILFKIILPLSSAALATISLFYAVWHWNSWFDAVMFVSNRKLWTVQVFLRQIIQSVQAMDLVEPGATIENLPQAESIQMATIVVASVPIICVYPFLQKYFVKGVMVGSLKG